MELQENLPSMSAIYRKAKHKEFQIFSLHCTHLGCPVSWFDEPGLFLCPCHGSVFYADGGYAAGPAPRGLYEMKYKIEGDQLCGSGGSLCRRYRNPGQPT